jgi:hypothetical protein
MATTGDILAPQLLEDGTFEEVTLTPASIGAATTEALANTPRPHISATPPSPVVNGTVWVDSATLRAHILTEGIWAEIATA